VNTVFETPAFDEIVRIHAYGLWESEGRPHGRDVEHWLRSQEEIRRFAETKMAEEPVTTAKKPRAKKLAKSAASGSRSTGAIRGSPAH
jgi:hypothetical protein